MKMMRDLVGETFSGRYRMISRIAGGGMGEVYRAHDLLLDRPVAVKVLQPSLARDPELVDRFRLEARAAARLTHPNVVGVYDWGEEDDGTPYMVMEYVPGTDLRDVLVSRGVLDPSQAAEVVAAVCDALAAAHAEGLVHRDVKPENVLLGRTGKVKVADFGIAVFGDAERAHPGGSVSGTLRYLAPEQAQGRDATSASDVWAAGVLLFECLTGRPPSMGAGADLLRARAEEQPTPPSVLEPGIPKDLDDVVLRACALEPVNRYPDAADMAADLRRVAVRSLDDAPPVRMLLDDVTSDIRLPDMEPTTTSARRRRRRRSGAPRVVAALVLLAFLVLGGVRAGAALLGPQEVDVPDLSGLTKERAERVAEEAGLVFDVAGRTRIRDVPKGDVISQDPASGVLVEGDTIAVVLSKGPPLTRVPKVVGGTLDDATDALESALLVPGEVTKRWSTEHPHGVVMAVGATTKRLPEGTTVDLVVSRGPRTLEVPDVAGMKSARAATVLEDAGFVPVLVDSYSDTVKPGRVVSSDPGAGAPADEGSDVTVYVSIGPEFEKLTMPDVRGMTVEQAKRKLVRLGLRVHVVVSCEGGTTVVETEPLAGSTVRENDRIALFVC